MRHPEKTKESALMWQLTWLCHIKKSLGSSHRLFVSDKGLSPDSFFFLNSAPTRIMRARDRQRRLTVPIPTALG